MKKLITSAQTDNPFLKKWIVYEDKQFLILNKPVDLTTMGTTQEDSLYRRALSYVSKKKEKLFTAHRLDKPTSGVVIFVKDHKSLEIIQGLFKKRYVEKEYLALCHKNAVDIFDETQWDQNIKKNMKYFNESGRKWVELNLPLYGIKNNSRVDFIKGVPACTRLSLEKVDGDYALIRVRPKTGKFHQIRTHLSFMGFPIIGDELYGGEEAKRLFLHAYSVQFTWTVTKKRHLFTTEIPSDFFAMLKER